MASISRKAATYSPRSKSTRFFYWWTKSGIHIKERSHHLPMKQQRKLCDWWVISGIHVNKISHKLPIKKQHKLCNQWYRILKLKKVLNNNSVNFGSLLIPEKAAYLRFHFQPSNLKTIKKHPRNERSKLKRFSNIT